MPVRISAPCCKTALTVDDSVRGQTMRCPHCQAALRVPAPRPTSPVQPAKSKPPAPVASAPDDEAQPPPQPNVRRRGCVPAVLIGCGVLALATVVLGVVGVVALGGAWFLTAG